jgi:hypothetical protein
LGAVLLLFDNAKHKITAALAMMET